MSWFPDMLRDKRLTRLESTAGGGPLDIDPQEPGQLLASIAITDPLEQVTLDHLHGSGPNKSHACASLFPMLASAPRKATIEFTDKDASRQIRLMTLHHNGTNLKVSYHQGMMWSL